MYDQVMLVVFHGNNRTRGKPHLYFLFTGLSFYSSLKALLHKMWETLKFKAENKLTKYCKAWNNIKAATTLTQ